MEENHGASPCDQPSQDQTPRPSPRWQGRCFFFKNPGDRREPPRAQRRFPAVPGVLEKVKTGDSWGSTGVLLALDKVGAWGTRQLVVSTDPLKIGKAYYAATHCRVSQAPKERSKETTTMIKQTYYRSVRKAEKMEGNYPRFQLSLCRVNWAYKMEGQAGNPYISWSDWQGYRPGFSRIQSHNLVALHCLAAVLNGSNYRQEPHAFLPWEVADIWNTGHLFNSEVEQRWKRDPDEDWSGEDK